MNIERFNQKNVENNNLDFDARLRGMLGGLGGWADNVDVMVAEAIRCIEGHDIDKAISIVEKVRDDHKKDLEFHTKKISGSGSQEELISNSYAFMTACKRVLEKLR